jgi:hypothetical protein
MESMATSKHSKTVYRIIAIKKLKDSENYMQEEETDKVAKPLS